jgi:hypothetical protein
MKFKQSRCLAAIDLPSDINGSIGPVRRILVNVFNSSRGSDTRMALLQATLRTVLAHIDNSEVKEEVVEVKPKRNKVAK